jgi:hypothetical protein
MILSEFREAVSSLSWKDFEDFVADVLKASGQFKEIETNVVVNGLQIDIRAKLESVSTLPQEWIFEIKSTKLVGSDAVNKLGVLRAMARAANVVLVAAGGVTAQAREHARELGVEIWDAAKLADLASRELMEKYFSVSGKPHHEPVDDKSVSLLQSLDVVKPGKDGWSKFQKLASDIFEYLFCPPLGAPRYEVLDREARNRRDMIFENSALDGFWSSMRHIYRAHYLVVDAKNYAAPLKKQPVLELAHYLKPYECGMFGILISRVGAGAAAQHAIREQWIGAEKLILVLSDAELREMIEMKGQSGAPEEMIRRIISNFRMSL